MTPDCLEPHARNFRQDMSLRRWIVRVALGSSLLSTNALAQGSTSACLPTAGHSHTLEGCQQERAKAESSCAAKDFDACLTAGADWEPSERNLSAPGDAEKALHFYELACKGGNPTGCSRMADLLLDDAAGKHKDVKRGLALLEKECANRHPGACARLGHLYREGKSVKQSLPRATSFLDKACRLGAGESSDQASEGMWSGLDAEGACEELYQEALERHDVKTANTYYQLGCDAGQCPER